MGIKLNWDHTNPSCDEIRLYRSLNPIDPQNLPEPLAVLGPEVRSYTDSTVQEKQVYFYRLGIVNNGREGISGEYSILNHTETGPGPKTLTRGDWNRGMFGRLTASEFFTGSELMELCNVPTPEVRTMDDIIWIKYALDRKVLFIPLRPIALGVSWDELYQLGLVYGVDGPGPFTGSDGIPVNQTKIVSKFGSQFKVRLMTGSNSITEYTDETDQSEWDRFFNSIYRDSSSLNYPYRLDRVVFDRNILGYNASRNATRVYSWTQSPGNNDSSRLGRGALNTTNESSFNFGSARSEPSSQRYYRAGSYSYSEHRCPCWQPVLELVI